MTASEQRRGPRLTRLAAVFVTAAAVAVAGCGEDEPAPTTTVNAGAAQTESGAAEGTGSTTTEPPTPDEPADDGEPQDGSVEAPTPAEEEEIVERSRQGYQEIREAVEEVAADGDLEELVRLRERMQALREEFCARPDVPQRFCRELD